MKPRIIGWSGWLVTWAICLSGRAQQNPNGRLPISTLARPYAFLARDPVVYEQLALSAEQQRAVRQVNDKWDAALWSMRNKSADQIDATLQRVTSATREGLAAILTPVQQQRLRQIELWVLGTKALLRDDFARQVALSQQQQSEIRDLFRDAQAALSELGKKLSSSQDRPVLEKQAAALQTATHRKIVAVLNDAQKQRWAAALGRRVDVARLGRIRFRAPELSTDGSWLNSQPLSLRQLKGKVVALHFYAFG